MRTSALFCLIWLTLVLAVATAASPQEATQQQHQPHQPHLSPNSFPPQVVAAAPINAPAPAPSPALSTTITPLIARGPQCVLPAVQIWQNSSCPTCTPLVITAGSCLLAYDTGCCNNRGTCPQYIFTMPNIVTLYSNVACTEEICSVTADATGCSQCGTTDNYITFTSVASQCPTPTGPIPV